MSGKGFVGYDFNLLEVFSVLFFKTASLIFLLFFCLPQYLHIPYRFFFVVVDFWF